MDNWHSEWVVEGPDFDTSQNSPQFPTVQWSEGEEDITVDSPNLSRYSNESFVGEKELCEKIDSPVKPSFKNVTLAKKRLQAYTKQTNKSTSKDEKKDSEDKPEKHVAKKSKKALYPDEKAKMVIQEIEVIKKKEVEENLKKQQLFAEVLKSYTSTTLRPRSRSLSSERTKHFKKREIKSRNYRRTDSIGRKSVSPDDPTRRSGRRSSPGHKKSMYPKNWTEYKQQKLTIAKDETLKKKCFPSHSNSSIDLYNKIYSFCVPSPPIEIFRCSTEHGEKLIPTPYVRFTKSKPPIIFSVNFEVIKESHLSRKQLFQTIPKEREATIKKLIDNPSKVQPSNKRNRSQPWYHKSWKKSGEPECKILENSVGLSFLQNYSDEEEENETEEIVICSSVKKKKDQNETASILNDRNKINKELVNFPEESTLDDVKKQKPDSEVAPLMENPQIIQVEDQNEDRLTPIKLDRDFETDEKNEQDDEKFENNEEKIEFEERLTPIKFDLKLQIGKKNERDLEKEAVNKHETKIEMVVDNNERLTPEQVSYYNEMINYSPDRLTPEEIPKCDKSEIDKVNINITKSAIEELQKELKKRENFNEENRGKIKKKKKKAGMKRKMESSGMEEDELPKAKKRKKKNKQKKKVSEEEEDSMSSEDEKRKKKQKKGSKRKKEKSKKKRNKYKKDKTRQAKTKKKKVPSEEKSKKEKSSKKKNEASEDLTFSDESKKKPKNKAKKKRQKEVSVSEDTSISKDKKVSKDISVQDQVQKMPEKKKNNDWEDEELLSNTFHVLEKERNERINSSKSSHFELGEKLKDSKSEKLEKDQKNGKEKERRRHSKENYLDVMSESEAIKSVDESQYLDLSKSRERGILDHASGGGKDKERKSARGKKYADEHSDLEIESSKKRSTSKERHRKQKEGKSRRIEEVRPPLFIKQEPDWEEKSSSVKKQRKHKEDALITKNLEDFPLVKDALGVAEDLDTPDTDEYRGNWEKDPFPVWESEDESVPKAKEKINTSWESDEDVYERARVIDKPLDFTEGLDLEIPLNIKPFKRREVIDADKELQLLKIESQTLNEERIQLELEKIKVKQLELSVIKEVESKEEEQPPKRRKSVEDTAEEVEDKAKRRRWDRREAEPSRKPAENIVVIDLSESTSSVNTSAVLENEYEEFIKAVTSKPRQEDARKFNDSVISLSSFSDFSDSNCSFDNAFGKKFIDVQPLKMSTPIKNDLARMSEAPVSQIIIAPKDIPFIPMPGEVKPVPVPSPPITAIASPGLLGLPARIPTSIIETPSNNTPEHLNTGAPTFDAPTFGAPTFGAPTFGTPSVGAPTLQESLQLVEKPVTPTLTDIPAKNREEVVSSSLQESKVDIFENKVSENVVESTNNSTLEVALEEKPSSSVRQNTPGKPFTFTSLVLPSKKLLMDNSRLNLDDSDDESKTRMKAIDEIRMEKSIRWNKLEEPTEELKELKKETKLEAKQETKPETKQETKLEAKQETKQETKQQTKPETKQEAKQETKQETKQEAKLEAKQETKQQESKDEAKQASKGKVQEEKHEMKKSEVGEKSVKAGNRDRKQSRSRSPRSRGHHGRDKIERRGASPKRGSDSSHSSRYRRRDSSPRRRGRSPKKHSSPTQSPARRNSSPGVRRRYSSRRSTSPIHRRRSPSPRRKSPKRPTSPKTSSSKSRNIRSKSPQKPESTVKSHQTSQFTEKPLLETHTQKLSAITASPLEELKKSVADSTISDDSLLPQPNLEDLAESPVSHFYGRPRPDTSRQLSMNEGVRQILGYEKEDFRPVSTPKPDMPKQVSMNEGVRQILGYAKEDLRPISTTYDNHGYDQNQLSQILKTIGQFSMSTKSEASTSSKSEASQENVFRNIAAVSVNIEVPITKAYKNVPTTQNSFVQVGNMVQIVPSDFNIKTENVQTVISNRHAGHENKLLQQEKKARIVQVGNMLQIVPNDSPPEPILPPLPVLPPLPPEPKIEPVENLKVVAKVISEQEKQSAEKAMKQKVAEQREERERRRLEREARRKEKEKRRREKEKHRQIKMKQKTENMIKRALQLEVEGEEGGNSLLNETPAQWPPLPSISSSSKDANKSILVLGHRKSVKLDRRKVVQFADGVRPGEGTSPSAGEELSSSPRYRKLPKEKRYTKTKMRMKDKKKKIKVKIIKPITDMDESDEDDHLPPPSPPPGSPPPHIFPPRVKSHPVNNIHPYVANLMPTAPSSQSPVLYRPSLNVLLPPLPPTHHHLPPPLPLPMPPHHMSGRPPEPPMMHHGSLQGMSQLHVQPPPPPLPPTVQTAGGSHRSLSYHY